MTVQQTPTEILLLHHKIRDVVSMLAFLHPDSSILNYVRAIAL